MGELTISTFLSLDGVMQAPGGPTEDPSGGFTLGGWLVPFFDDGVGAAMTEIFTKVDAFCSGGRLTISSQATGPTCPARRITG